MKMQTLMTLLMLILSLSKEGLRAADVSDLTYRTAGIWNGVFDVGFERGTILITDCDTAATGELIIPDTIGGKRVTAIMIDAFRECKGLTGIVIPDSVTRIENGAFEGCTSLPSITIPDSVTKLGYYVFSSCKNLKNITLGDSVASIGFGCFGGCPNLESITFRGAAPSIVADQTFRNARMRGGGHSFTEPVAHVMLEHVNSFGGFGSIFNNQSGYGITISMGASYLNDLSSQWVGLVEKNKENNKKITELEGQIGTITAERDARPTVKERDAILTDIQLAYDEVTAASGTAQRNLATFDYPANLAIFDLVWTNSGNPADTIGMTIEFPQSIISNPLSIGSNSKSVLTIKYQGSVTVIDEPRITFNSPVELDFSQELIGQNGFGPRGRGDFNLLGVAVTQGIFQGNRSFGVMAPNGSIYDLTSMKPRPVIVSKFSSLELNPLTELYSSLIATSEEAIVARDSVIAARDASISALEDEKGVLAAQVSSLEETVTARDTSIASLKDEKGVLAAQVSSLEETVTARDTFIASLKDDKGGLADTDGDGVANLFDTFPNDSNETADTDGDGVGDNGDAFPEDPNEVADTDGDGVGDKSDAFPNDANETADTDGDGIGDNADPFPNGGGLNKVVFFQENFDSLVLRPFESASESNGSGADWTDELLSGWQMIKGPNHGPTNGGIAVKEFDGWTFLDPVSWNATSLQGRDQFTKGVGVIAVADSDEYDDQADATFDASLITPVIDISGALENSLILKFDSSWRKEPQTGYVSVQYDGGDEMVILSRDEDTPDALNETIELPLNNPEGTKNLVIKWNYKGQNNWWWAIDNIIIKSQGILNTAPIAEGNFLTMNQGVALPVKLIGSDIDGDRLTYEISPPQNGILSGTAPNMIYEANDGFSGTDTFSFKVNDGQVSSDLATVEITVVSVKPSIIANKSFYKTGEPIGAVYSNAPGNAKDWIAVYRDGDVPGESSSIFWKYTNGSRSGEWRFGSLPSGSYRLYLLENNSYSYVASSTFNVTQDVEGNSSVVDIKKGTNNQQFAEFVHFDPFVLELLGFSNEPLQSDSKIVLFDGAGNEIKTIQSLSGKVEENYKIKFGGSDGIPISPGDYYVAVKEGKDFLAQSAIRIKDATNSSIETTWTIFVYGHGDSNINGKFLQDIEEMRKAKGNDKFRIVLQADYDGSDEEKLAEFGVPEELWNKVSRIVFDGSGETVVDVLDEQDMDDPQVLHGFLEWGMSEYKADKYGLILWDHGAGWKGFGGDLNNNNQNNDGINLQNLEIRQAIKDVLENNQISKFDFLSFDACLMGGVEQLVDMRDICRLYIANPETDYGHGWDYANSLAYLRMYPDMSMADFAQAESRFWDAHHDDAFDEGYKVHCSYDMTLFTDYNIKFNAFLEALLNEAKSGNSKSANLLAKLRREAIHYDNQSPRSGESVITDFIDVGSFASAVSKNFEGLLSVASLDLVNAIDNLIISKVLGSQRQDASGLSIYYPINGSVDQGYGLELAFIKDSFGGETWIDYMAEVRQDNLNNDLPLTVQSPNPNAKSGRVEGFLSDQIDLFDVQIASYADPAIMSFEVTEGDDAYSATASLVTNELTENVNEFLYLGEIGSGMLDGEGEYDLEWDSTMPILSLADSEFYDPIYLGGYAIEPGSNIHVSFADYLAPGTEEYVPLILYTTFDEFGYGFIDTIMEDTIQTDGSDQFSLSPVEFDQGIEPGGRLLPVYYMEELVEDEYYSYFKSFEDVFIDIPENGLEGIEISYQSVTEGNYAVELQIFDHFDNGSDILTYFLEVPEEEDEEEEEALPEVSIYLENGQVVVSWPITEEIYLLERSSELSPDQWGIVPIEEITIEGEEFVLRTAPDNKAQFYRLTD
ncbi:MAG: hypothetical protein CMD92_07260 [Gammaproteobacteria bacterium]|nr:hypothetical protein [Gammaproteobacteria bacterium]